MGFLGTHRYLEICGTAWGFEFCRETPTVTPGEQSANITDMGASQNSGPILVLLNIRCCNILHNQKAHHGENYQYGYMHVKHMQIFMGSSLCFFLEPCDFKCRDATATLSLLCGSFWVVYSDPFPGNPYKPHTELHGAHWSLRDSCCILEASNENFCRSRHGPRNMA